MKMSRNVKIALNPEETTDGSLYHLASGLLTRVCDFFGQRDKALLDDKAALKFLRKHGSKNNRAIARVGTKLITNISTEKLDR